MVTATITWRENVGQDVPHDDAAIPRSHGNGRPHILDACQSKRLRTDLARELRPPKGREDDNHEGDEYVRRRGDRNERGQCQIEGQLREGEHDLDEALHQASNRPPR